ncbi:MAG: tetratricopeptide repeat protein, partial [Proteobacteria bacterium]|nr:tetratricopeptide repeat protein [Pseudomonadota bacterium]
DPATAVEHYRHALRLLPGHPDLVLALATALERAGRTDEAIGEVEMLLREHPARPGARALLERLRQPSPP